MKSLSLSLIIICVLLLPAFLTSCSGDECCDDGLYVKQTDTIYIVRQTLKPSADYVYYIQIAAFANKSSAEDFLYSARQKIKMLVTMKTSVNGLFLITVGEYYDYDDAEKALTYVKSEGFYDAFIKTDIKSK